MRYLNVNVYIERPAAGHLSLNPLPLKPRRSNYCRLSERAKKKMKNLLTRSIMLCPEHEISGGIILKRGRKRRVHQRAAQALRMAAYGLQRRDSAHGAKYRRLKSRLGAPKAIVAMAHHLARLVYRMLKHGEEYVDIGAAWYEARFEAQQRK